MLLSLALPAAAEETKTLYAETVVGTLSNEFEFPGSVTRQYRLFYLTVEDGKDVYNEVTGEVLSDNACLTIEAPTDDSKMYTLTGNGTGEAKVSFTLDGTTHTMTVKTVTPVFEVGTRENNEWGNWTNEVDVQVGVPTRVAFRWGASGIYDSDVPGVRAEFSLKKDLTIEPKEGLTYENNQLTATAPGTYTIRYNNDENYSVTVNATAASAEIPVDELLTHSNDSTTDFVNYLRTNWGYKGTGPFTATLPGGDLGSIVWSAALPEKAMFTLQGSSDTENPTTISALSINGGTLCLDKVTLDGITGVTLNEGSGNFTARNCTFENTDQAFKFTSASTENLPTLTLSGNTFTNPKVLLGDDSTWTFTQGSSAAELNLSVAVDKNPERTEVTFKSNTDAYDKGWGLNFSTVSDYSNAYFVYYDTGLNKNIIYFDVPKFHTTMSLNKEDHLLTLSNPEAGKFTCVNGVGPVLEVTNASTRTLKISEAQAKYVQGVMMKSPFKAATVNDNKVDSVQYSSGLLYFDTKTKGTYIIKEVKLPAEETKVATRLYTISTKDVYPIYHTNFMNTLRLTRDGNVKINCKEAGRRPISIPVESLEAAGAKGMTITLKAKNYSLLLDTAAVKSLAQQAKGDRVVLQYRSLNHKTMSNVGMASVNSHLEQYPNHVADLAFLVSATSDNESIVDLQMGTVTLTVPFIVLPGTEGYPNENFALMTETESQARKTEIADGNLITVLTDLTEHMVFLEPPVEETVPETTEATEPETIPETTEAPTEPPVQVEPEESKGFPIWIPIVLVALAGGGAAAWFLFFRKRKKAAE